MITDIDVAVSKRVKEMREKLSISQRVLAEIIDTSSGFIGQVESDRYVAKYSASQIYTIAKYFGCQVSDLFPPINPLEP